jgi:hypothetical protein
MVVLHDRPTVLLTKGSRNIIIATHVVTSPLFAVNKRYNDAPWGDQSLLILGPLRDSLDSELGIYLSQPTVCSYWIRNSCHRSTSKRFGALCSFKWIAPTEQGNLKPLVYHGRAVSVIQNESLTLNNACRLATFHPGAAHFPLESQGCSVAPLLPGVNGHFAFSASVT